jgi:chromate transporter
VIAAQANGGDPRLWALTAAATVAVLATRLNLLWLIGAGAVAGAAGLAG